MPALNASAAVGQDSKQDNYCVRRLTLNEWFWCGSDSLSGSGKQSAEEREFRYVMYSCIGINSKCHQP